MYSSYWKPQDGRESNVLTDHEALHRDAATHKSIQSDETKLRPLDLETIMSSKAAVKFWYLHRPKTMEYVHKNATKIQSVGRAFAVRQLKKKYGIEYMVELAKQDELRRQAEKLKDMDDEARANLAAEDAAYDARVEESRRLRREQIAKEQEAENALRQRLAEEAKRRQETEEARLAALAEAEAAQRLLEEEERMRQEEARLARMEEEERLAEEANKLRLAEEARLAQEAAEEEARRLKEAEEEEARRLKEAEEEEARRLQDEEEEQAHVLATAALGEQQRREEEETAAAAAAAAALAAEAERQRLEEERIRLEEEEAAAEERRMWEEEEVAEAAALAAAELKRREEQELRERREREETERALAAAALEAQKIEQARQQRLKEEKAAKYEQSLSKDVPVLVRNHGPGRVVSYDQNTETYQVRLDNAIGGMQINVKASDVNLDDDRILSPRTKVDTPFGTGEVVGLDPHVGCYAINTEVNAPDGEQFLAFVQINDVHVHVEEVEERAIVENPSLPIPDEIRLVAARIVDSRVLNRTGKKFIQYKLEIRTSNYGTVYCWKRYSTFRSLCDRLHKETGIKKKDMPELPKRQIVGNFSQKTIAERADKLNEFLTAAVQAEHLQWGIRVDDQIAVYKRRVKKQQPPPPPPSSGGGGFFSRRR